MTYFIDFIVKNWNFIVLVILFVFNVILTFVNLVKNSKISKGYYSSLLSLLPTFINDAESKHFIDGKAKFDYVLEQSVIYLSELNGFSYNKNLVLFGNKLTLDIENILSTPQKK